MRKLTVALTLITALSANMTLQAEPKEVQELVVTFEGGRPLTTDVLGISLVKVEDSASVIKRTPASYNCYGGLCVRKPASETRLHKVINHYEVTNRKKLVRQLANEGAGMHAIMGMTLGALFSGIANLSLLTIVLISLGTAGIGALIGYKKWEAEGRTMPDHFTRPYEYREKRATT